MEKLGKIFEYISRRWLLFLKYKALYQTNKKNTPFFNEQKQQYTKEEMPLANKYKEKHLVLNIIKGRQM